MRRQSIIAIAAATLVVAGCAPASERAEKTARVDSASGSSAAATTATTTSTTPGAVAADSVLVVYKTPTCGCCKGWVEHMQKAGFAVEVHDMPDLSAVKREAGVPDELQTCHTARIGGYVIEGHVPATDVRRLLAERPAVAGIGTPGMPMGSPGMEGAYRDRYDVVTFGGSGKSTVFASH
ncbi:MAG TPA: DUF411 domain-containing protein [Gemmatimonadaceae bacterium]|nr:DUF411 domain-containing protein [Gemmatimonadaceae bacterium]